MPYKTIAAMFGQFEKATTLKTLYEEYTLEQTLVQKALPIWYLGEFNTLTCATAKGATYYYFCQTFGNIQTNILVVELGRIVNKLVDHFGIDELGQGKFQTNEVQNTNWKGREWRYGEMGIILGINQGICLYFFKAAPAENEEKGVYLKLSHLIRQPF